MPATLIAEHPQRLEVGLGGLLFLGLATFVGDGSLLDDGETGEAAVFVGNEETTIGGATATRNVSRSAALGGTRPLPPEAKP